MGQSSRKPTSRKANVNQPPKPYGDFPLTPHNGGQWMKKFKSPKTGKSKIHYFGRWGRMVDGKMERLPGDGWQNALTLYKARGNNSNTIGD